MNFHFTVVNFVIAMFVLQPDKLVTSSVQRGEADGASVVTPVVSDRSPLIKNATSPPPLIADATVFDNAAIVEPPQETTSDPVTSGVDRKLSDLPPEVGRNVAGAEATPKARSASNKKRKVLSIVSDERFVTWTVACRLFQKHKSYNRHFGPGRRLPKSHSSCCCSSCWNQFCKGPKIPKAFLILSGVQRTFANTFVLTLPTDLPSQIFHSFSN